ncbi:MAG: hypothetical protein HYV63_23325 [Candidatus Schekmanbacteria bacterium]|nr:hypothetical protein [Candidatus Schekmanbacteria bacterium]
MALADWISMESWWGEGARVPEMIAQAEARHPQSAWRLASLCAACDHRFGSAPPSSFRDAPRPASPVVVEDLIAAATTGSDLKHLADTCSQAASFQERPSARLVRIMTQVMDRRDGSITDKTFLLRVLACAEDSETTLTWAERAQRAHPDAVLFTLKRYETALRLGKPRLTLQRRAPSSTTPFANTRALSSISRGSSLPPATRMCRRMTCC